MATVFLLLGSNMGNSLEYLAEAQVHLEAKIGSLIQESSRYRTAAWGNTDQADFINQVLKMETSLLPQDLLGTILAIEKDMGRSRAEKWGPRTIDIDILYYNQEVINLPDLQIPHPCLQERAFTLVPLCELEPSFVHPVLNQTNSQLFHSLTDSLPVIKL